MKLLEGYPKTGNIEGVNNESPTRFKVTVFERDWKNMMVQIEEIHHDGRPLNSDMERAIIEEVGLAHDEQENVIEYYIKRTGDREYRVVHSSEQMRIAELSKKGQENEVNKEEQGYYFSTKKDIRNLEGMPTTYIYEEAGPKLDRAELFVLSNSLDNKGSALMHHELEIAQQIADDNQIELTEVKMFVEQNNGRYLLRTFREYQLSAPQHEGESGRTTIQQNYEDRKGDTFSRKEVDGYLLKAQEQQQERAQSNTQEINLSRHSMDIQFER